MKDLTYNTRCREAIYLMFDRWTRVKREDIWPESQELIYAQPELFGRFMQRTFGAGDIMHNRVRCLSCQSIIESLNRHDFQTCRCGQLSVDGGSWYCKRSGDLDNYTDLSEQWPWIEESSST